MIFCCSMAGAGQELIGMIGAAKLLNRTLVLCHISLSNLPPQTSHLTLQSRASLVLCASLVVVKCQVLPDLVEGRWMANHAHDRARQPVSDFYDINILNQ